TIAFSVELTDPYGNVLPAGIPVLSSDNAADDTSGSTVSFTEAGTRTITATVGELTATATVTVTPDAANPAAISISPLHPSATAGDTIAFVVDVRDAYGNPLSGASASATLSSSDPTDVVGYRSVTVGTAGSHTVTATLGNLTAVTTVSVAADAAHPASITMTSPDLTVDQGDPVPLDLAGRDAYRHPL